MPAIVAPLPQFFDLNGAPLEGGSVFIGAVGGNPETSPVAVYWDSALTQPAVQPLRTSRGYVARGGTPAAVYADGAYSLTAKQANGVRVLYVPTSAEIDAAMALRGDLASSVAASAGAGQVGFAYALNYAAGTIGAAVRDGYVNVMWFMSEAQAADIKARTLSLDLTTTAQAAHTWANGRPVYYPKGAYKVSTLTLPKAGDGIVGDSSGGMNGDDGTLLVSTVTGTTAAVQLTNSTAHNVLLKDFTLKQQSGTIQGRGVVAQDCYWLRTDNLRVIGFTDNLYISLAIYHHHKRLFSEKSTNGVNYWGASGTWNTDWFNNVVTFDTCRFSECTVTGITFKGCEAVFINPDFTGMSAVGAIGLKVFGESASFKAHGIKIVAPYIENTKIAFSFLHARVEIDGDGFVQGGANVGAQAESIIDADASHVLLSGLEDKDYWAFGYRLTNASTLRQRVLFSGSIRASAGTADATSSFLSEAYSAGTFTVSLTGCTAAVTGTASWEKRGSSVTLLIPALSGTSNTTAATLTGLPAAIQPLTEQFAVGNVINSGAELIGALRVFTSGTVGLSAGIFGAAFTAAGVKGVRAVSLSYSVA